jgi:hypothetical protein
LSNCGGCGVPCNAPGLCIAGSCDALTPRVLDTGSFGQIALDATNVFYVETTLDELRSTPKSGGAVVVLATGQDVVGGIAADSTHVYWSTSTGNEIRRVLKSGGTVEVVSAATAPSRIALSADHVFWANEANATVLRAQKSGSITPDVVGVAPSGVGDVAVVGDYVYWVNLDSLSGWVERRLVDLSAVAELYSGQDLQGQLAADQESLLYFDTDFYGPGLRRIDLTTDALDPTVLGPSIAQRKLDLAAGRHFLFYINEGFTAGRKTSECGGPELPQAIFGYDFGPVIVTDEAFYYTAYSGELRRRPQD